MSPGKLLWRTVFDLVLAVLIGAAISASILYFDIRRYIDNDGELAVLAGVHALGIPLPYFEEQGKKQVGHLAGDFRQTPPDDQALAKWFAGQPGVERVRIVPRGKNQRVEVRYRLPLGQKDLEPPWEKLGYKEISFGFNYSEPLLARLPKKADFLLQHLACLQIGLLVVAVGRLTRMHRRREPLPKLWAGPTRRALLLGLVASLLVGGLVWACEQALRHFFGRPDLTESFWIAITYGTDRFLQVFAGLTIVLLAPLLHELFFRGLLFGSWASAGWVWTGALVSALAAAALRLDWYRLPQVFLLGLILAWLFRRTGSLLAPLTAHVAGNAVALGLVLGWIPNLTLAGPPIARNPFFNDLIIGVWENEDPTGGQMKFGPDGALTTQMVIGGGAIDLEGGHYEFVAADRIHFVSPVVFAGARLEITKKIILTQNRLTLLDESPGPDGKMRTKVYAVYKRVK
jgi:membrane protease YdiL (CAAX protease family)